MGKKKKGQFCQAQAGSDWVVSETLRRERCDSLIISCTIRKGAQRAPPGGESWARSPGSLGRHPGASGILSGPCSGSLPRGRVGLTQAAGMLPSPWQQSADPERSRGRRVSSSETKAPARTRPRLRSCRRRWNSSGKAADVAGSAGLRQLMQAQPRACRQAAPGESWRGLRLVPFRPPRPVFAVRSQQLLGGSPPKDPVREQKKCVFAQTSSSLRLLPDLPGESEHPNLAKFGSMRRVLRAPSRSPGTARVA